MYSKSVTDFHLNFKLSYTNIFSIRKQFISACSKNLRKVSAEKRRKMIPFSSLGELWTWWTNYLVDHYINWVYRSTKHMSDYRLYVLSLIREHKNKGKKQRSQGKERNESKQARHFINQRLRSALTLWIIMIPHLVTSPSVTAQRVSR